MNRKSVFHLAILSVCAVLLNGSPARSAVTFTTIANSATPVPGTASDHFSFYLPGTVQYDGSNVAFIGGGTTLAGVYSGTSTLSPLLTSATTVPGTSSPFGYLPGIGYSNGNFIVIGGTTSTAPNVFTSTGSGLTKIADTSTTEPGGAVTFTSFSGVPAISSTGVYGFIGASTHASPTAGGIYSNIGSGTLHALADRTMLLPGSTSNYSSFVTPAFDGNTVAYGGASSTGTALLLQTGNSAPTIAVNQNTPVPGGTGNFTFFFNPSYSNSRLAFFGGGTDFNSQGAYLLANGQVTLIADRNTAIPGVGGTFSSVTGALVDSDGDVVFAADRSIPASSISGYYLSHNGVISKIVEMTDTLDGHTINSLDAGYSFANGAFAFHASFTDGSEGVYLASVPEPATVALLLPVGMAMLGRRRR